MAKMSPFHSSKSKPPNRATERSEEKTATKWMKTRGKEIHPVFGVETEYDAQRDQYLSPKAAAIEYLSNVVSTHDSNCDPHEPTFSGCSWAKVLETLEEARSDYSSRKHPGSPLIKGMDLACELKDALPDEFGLEVVKGVLGIVFETAKRRRENRARILEAFESIPETILAINFSCRLLKPTTEDLQLREEFYHELVTRMPELVNILLGNTAWYKKVRSYFTLKISETYKIDETLSEWNRYIAALKQRSVQMRVRLQSETAYHSSEAHRISTQINHRVENLESGSDEIKAMIKAVGGLLMANMQQNYGNARAVQRHLQPFQPESLGAQAQTLLFQGWKDLGIMPSSSFPEGFDIYEPTWEDQEADFTDSCVQSARSEPCAILTPLELLGLLGVGPSTVLGALEFILQQSSKRHASLLRQVACLNRMDEFRDWYHEPCSSLLLVEGFLDTPPSERITALSIFNASFILNISPNPTFITLSFFAGLHGCTDADQDADTVGPCGLIRSLIAQILAHEYLPPPNLSFFTPLAIEDCQMNDISALCELFRRLMLQMPAEMQVFCIIDGLAVYECEPQWKMEMDHVAALLEHLAEITRGERYPVVRIMLTFGNRSLQVIDRARDAPDLWTHVALLGRRI